MCVFICVSQGISFHTQTQEGSVYRCGPQTLLCDLCVCFLTIASSPASFHPMMNLCIHISVMEVNDSDRNTSAPPTMSLPPLCVTLSPLACSQCLLGIKTPSEETGGLRLSLNGGFSVTSHCTLYGDTAVEEKQGLGDKNKDQEDNSLNTTNCFHPNSRI